MNSLPLLYLKGHKIFQGHLKAFSDEEVKKLKAKIEDILEERKYLRMAELAAVPYHSPL